MSYVFFSPGGFGRKFRLRFFRRSGSSFCNQNLWMKGFAGWRSMSCFFNAEKLTEINLKKNIYKRNFIPRVGRRSVGVEEDETPWLFPRQKKQPFQRRWVLMVRNPTKSTGKSTKSTGFDSDARVLTGYRSASICAFAFKIKFEEAEISNATGLLELAESL